MKTLVKQGFSLYLFDDAEEVTLLADKIVVGNPAKRIIADCNNSDSTLYENVSPPEEWSGRKYFFIDGVWSLNPDWKPPSDDDI